MKITLNKNTEIVKTVREGLKQNDGYCPCKLDQTPDNKCICSEFRDMMNDPDFEGYCHCMLYYKTND